MVTPELFPLAKVGGLADMVSSLSIELARLGHDVRVVMPRYYGISKTQKREISGPLGVPVGFGEQWCGVVETELPSERAKVPVYLLDHDHAYGRDGVYGDRVTPHYHDNPFRFTLLCRAAFQLCRKLGWIPDVMHVHDWPAALVPVYLATWERHGTFARTASLLTIHNLGHQGIYSKHEIVHTQLPWEQLHSSGLEHYDSINLLKAGLVNADLLTTVSPTYAREIQTPALGAGLDGLLRHRASDLFGVLNGIDYDVWNPETDPALEAPYARYSDKDLSGKEACKVALQREMGLPRDPQVPLIGMVGRLADQKGLGALAGPSHGSLYSICKDLAVQVVILGLGERWCMDELSSLAARLPNLAVRLELNEELAHRIEAGSDLFLMPSSYEPCGLNQLYSLRYGTLPIVRRTGGLADTVTTYDEDSGGGTGFVFDELTPRAIYDTVGWAVWAWYNRQEHVQMMRRRAMQQRFSWDESARLYAERFQWAIDRRTGAVPRT
jgi:starch synthase